MKMTLTLLILLTVFSLGTFAQDFPYINLEGHEGDIGTIAYSPDGATLASGGWDRTIRLWDATTGEHKAILTRHTGPVMKVVFSPDGLTLASGGWDHTIRLWDATTGEHKAILTRHTDRVLRIVFSPDGTILASAGSMDQTIRLWNVGTGEHKHTLTGHTDRIEDIVFSPDGLTLATASGDGTIHLWDPITGMHQKTIMEDIRRFMRINNIVFSPDGQTLASGAGGLGPSNVHLWDVNTGKLKKVLTGHLLFISSLAFSPDGQILVSGSGDSTIRFWDAKTGYHKRTIIAHRTKEGHNTNVSYLVFSPNGRSVVSGTFWDMRLWDAVIGEQIITFPGYGGGVFSPDGRTFASIGVSWAKDDKFIRLWQLPSALRTTSIHITSSTDTTLSIGEQFVINVNIADGQDMQNYQLALEYDNETLRYVSHSPGDYLSDDAFISPVVSAPGLVSLDITSPAEIGTSEGTIVTIMFEVAARKASTFTVSATLSDSNGERLSAAMKSGRAIESPLDVNGDGSVDILDLSFVASHFGKIGHATADVNKDGVVDIRDLVLVAGGIDGGAAAPSAWSRDIEVAPTSADVKKWLTQARQLNLTDPTSQKGILFLEYLLATLAPKETVLLPNYPNPFNPETWIPYQLAQSADITISIYAVDGTVIRTLDLGHKPSGIYQDKTRAAYWDGRNNVGELVASGVYFYTLTAGNFKSTRKMLILK